MHQQLLGCKVEEKLHLGAREQKKAEYRWSKLLETSLHKLPINRNK
jgi:hypothetical protein